ncbi:MAG: hypothetical protein ACXW2U_01005 [Telluria sp.]
MNFEQNKTFKLVIALFATFSAIALLQQAGVFFEPIGASKIAVYMLCVFALDRFYTGMIWLSVLFVKPEWIVKK